MEFEKILDEVIKINNLLDKYFFILYENDFEIKTRLTESEQFNRNQVILELNTCIKRLRNDTSSIDNITCDKKSKQERINRILINLAGEVLRALRTLDRFKTEIINDKEIQDILKELEYWSHKFGDKVDKFNENSLFRVYDWGTCQDIFLNEEEETLKKHRDLFGSSSEIEQQ